MEMSHLSSRSLLPLQHCSHTEGGGSPPSSSAETIKLSLPIVSCSVKPQLLSVMPSTRAGCDPCWEHRGSPVPLHTSQPQGVCGFVLHLRGNPPPKAVLFKQGENQSSPIAASTAQSPGAGQGCSDALPPAGDWQHGMS